MIHGKFCKKFTVTIKKTFSPQNSWRVKIAPTESTGGLIHPSTLQVSSPRLPPGIGAKCLYFFLTHRGPITPRSHRCFRPSIPFVSDSSYTRENFSLDLRSLPSVTGIYTQNSDFIFRGCDSRREAMNKWNDIKKRSRFFVL